MAQTDTQKPQLEAQGCRKPFPITKCYVILVNTLQVYSDYNPFPFLQT